MIKCIDNQDWQNEIRILINNKLKDKIRNMPFNKNLQRLQNKHEHEISKLKNIERKLKNNEAIVTNADKGNTLVIMQRSDYNVKVNNFISSDNYEALSEDPTKKYTLSLNAQIENSKLFIRW